MRWRWIGAVSALTLWALAAASLRATDPPAAPGFERETDRLVLVTPPPILAEPEVARQLTTGLTATLAFRVEVGDRRQPDSVGGARIEVRYELWDEVFYVRSLDAGGQVGRLTLASSEELEDWWSELRFVVLDPLPPASVGKAIRVTLDIVPFSHSEQLDTQRWFEEAVRRGEQGKNEAISQSTGGANESLGRVFSVLLATSIRRQALLAYAWTVDWPGEEAP